MQLEIVTPAGTAVTTVVDELIAPGQEGEFGVLPGHTPFISAIRPGVLRYLKSGVEQRLAVGGGLVEVSGADRIVVLTEHSEAPDQIDVAAARRDLEQAEQAARSGETGAEAARAWAQARLDTATRK